MKKLLSSLLGMSLSSFAFANLESTQAIESEFQTVKNTLQEGAYVVLSNGYDGSYATYDWTYNHYALPLSGVGGAISVGYQHAWLPQWLWGVEGSLIRSGGYALLMDMTFLDANVDTDEPGIVIPKYGEIRKPFGISVSGKILWSPIYGDAVFLRGGLVSTNFWSIPLVYVASALSPQEATLPYFFNQNQLGLQLGFGMDTAVSNQFSLRMEYFFAKYRQLSVYGDGTSTYPAPSGLFNVASNGPSSLQLFTNQEAVGPQYYRFNPIEEMMMIGVRYQFADKPVTAKNAPFRSPLGGAAYAGFTIQRDATYLAETIQIESGQYAGQFVGFARSSAHDGQIEVEWAEDQQTQLPTLLQLQGFNVGFLAGYRWVFSNQLQLGFEGDFQLSHADTTSTYRGRNAAGGGDPITDEFDSGYVDFGYTTCNGDQCQTVAAEVTNEVTGDSVNFSLPKSWKFAKRDAWSLSLLPGYQLSGGRVYGRVGLNYATIRRTGFENGGGIYYDKNFTHTTRGLEFGLGEEISVSSHLAMSMELDVMRYKPIIVNDGYYVYRHNLKGRQLTAGLHYQF